jgi:hypothetical protein
MEVSIDNLYGSEKYALFEVELPEAADETEGFKGIVKVEYTDAVTNSSVTLESPVEIRYTKDADEVARNRNTEIISQTELAKNAETREEAVRLADEGHAGEASKLLRNRKQELVEAAPYAGAAAPEIQAEAEYFDSLASDIVENGTMSNEQRKENVQRAYSGKNQQNESADSSY